MKIWERELWNRETFLENRKPYIDELRMLNEIGCIPLDGTPSQRVTKGTTIGEILANSNHTPDGKWKPTITLHGGKPTLMVPLRVERTFEEHIDEYLGGLDNLILPKRLLDCRENLKRRIYGRVPYEIRMGLIKHICDALSKDVLSSIKGEGDHILPAGLLHSV